MANQCILANPDISGVGVRAAIYAQNLLCFAPIVAHLWDGRISSDELTGVEDQSIGMLAIAFAILISTIIHATVKTSSQAITGFHAAVILDLSWMNNTSTFVWFLLYIHHRSKNNPIDATWRDWCLHFLSPLKNLREGWMPRKVSVSQRNHDTEQDVAHKKTFPQLIRPLLHLTIRAPVLTLGSIHLSLMASIGIWLWSNPFNFGVAMPCDPSLVIVGGAVRFSSRALRIWSMLVYSLLLIPGVNLIPGFLFFLILHISYNKSRIQHPFFWKRCQDLLLALQNTLRWILAKSRRQRPSPSDLEARVGNNDGQIPSGVQPAHLGDSSAGRMDQHSDDHGAIQSQANPAHLPSNGAHTALLLVGLACLVTINVIFLTDIERTISLNQQLQYSGENQWGFGQVLALLLLVIPIRDLITSITDVRRNVVQKRFEKTLREAIQGDTFVGHDFQDFLEQGADPNIELENDMKFVTLLQFAAFKGETSLVKYLLDVKEANPNTQGGNYGTALLAASAAGNIDAVGLLLGKNAHINLVVSGGEYGTAFQAASATGNIDLVRLLLGNGANVNLGGGEDGSPFQTALRKGKLEIAFLFDRNSVVGNSRVAMALKDSEWPHRDSQASQPMASEFREEIRVCIPGIAKCLKASQSSVRSSAIHGLSGLAAHEEFHEEIRVCIPSIVDCLKDPEPSVGSSAVIGLSMLVNHQFHDEIRMCIPGIVEDLKDSDYVVGRSTIEGLSSLAAHSEFRDVIRLCIPSIMQRLPDTEWWVGSMAQEGLSKLADHAEFREEIGIWIPNIAEHLKTSQSLVRSSAISIISTLAKHPEFREEIRMHIPSIVAHLKDPEPMARDGSMFGLLLLAEHSEFHEEIRMCIPTFAERLGDLEPGHRHLAIVCLSSFAKHPEFCMEIRMCIPSMVEHLKDSAPFVRMAAIHGITGLAAHAEFREEIRTCTPGIVECLKESDVGVLNAAIEGLSSLATHGELHEEIRRCGPSIVEYLKDLDGAARARVTEGLANVIPLDTF